MIDVHYSHKLINYFDFNIIYHKSCLHVRIKHQFLSGEKGGVVACLLQGGMLRAGFRVALVWQCKRNLILALQLEVRLPRLAHCFVCIGLEFDLNY